jgi:hypothetical protein
MYWWSSIVFISSLLSLHFIWKLPVLSYAKANILTIAVLFCVYLCIGLVWSFIKWILFLYRFKEERDERLEKFKEIQIKFKEYNPNVLDTRTESSVLKEYTYKGTNLAKAPSYKDYHSDIVAWVIFRIPSLIGTLLDDFVRKLVTFIVNRFGKTFQYLSQKIVGDFSEQKE